jgi:hypothetical protein
MMKIGSMTIRTPCYRSLQAFRFDLRSNQSFKQTPWDSAADILDFKNQDQLQF